MKQIALPDGTKVGMSGQTQIRVEPGYNGTDRKLVLLTGTARFDVVHVPDRPFVVDMGDVSVKDIGTSFTIERTADSIKVLVWEGKVAFARQGTGESREITGGKEESFYIAEHTFGEVGIRSNSLRFDDQLLPTVAAALEKAWGRKIVLGDSMLAQRRLTVHLEGEGFDDAIKIICASLNLDYRVENGAYVLRSKK
jgi:transmembrane sensor